MGCRVCLLVWLLSAGGLVLVYSPPWLNVCYHGYVERAVQLRGE